MGDRLGTPSGAVSFCKFRLEFCVFRKIAAQQPSAKQVFERSAEDAVRAVMREPLAASVAESVVGKDRDTVLRLDLRASLSTSKFDLFVS